MLFTEEDVLKISDLGEVKVISVDEDDEEDEDS